MSTAAKEPKTTTSPPSKTKLESVGSISSMDFFEQLQRSEDFQLDGGLGALSSEDLISRLKSSDFMKDILQDAALDGGLSALSSSLQSAEFIKDTEPELPELPDSAVTAAGAMKAGRPQINIEVKPQITIKVTQPTQKHKKISKLKAKLERNITGDELVPLNMSFRISSGNWIKEYEAEAESASLLAMHPSLFLGNHPSSFPDGAIGTQQPEVSSMAPPLPPPSFSSSAGVYEEYQVPLRPSGNKSPPKPTANTSRISSSEWIQDFKGERLYSGPMRPSVFEEVMNNAKKTPAKPKKKLKKKNRTRMLDENRAVEPTKNDVLCGRGGGTNNWPGNKRFREKALEFRLWYEKSSKEEKQRIADELVGFVKNGGNRFLGKGEDGLWYEMIGNGPHWKASQALRERLKGKSVS
eukprot:CAMPEP_0183713050 /NCGR_PEP_ID=MMETSP0737-20130205/8036_1 /TAXON_ID=385413 /ORGANISM="Thalassiosira miniscula, Strain CCMP1093" /LENGTH=409 /DNA_ID=CAMNT_0025941799 /DNA_START=77 /DNA_END=1306 /DNA_ORIENTATION=-